MTDVSTSLMARGTLLVMLEQRGNLWKMHADARCVTTNGIVKKDGAAVMGKGVAQQANFQYPGVDKLLGLRLKEGGNHVYLLRPDLASYPTKNHWHDPSDMDLIVQSAHELVALADEQNWRCVLLPRPGCGAGGLQWSVVKPLLMPILDERFVAVDR